MSVDGAQRLLPDPFFLIATQNPVGDLGTFPLVSGQRDRFALVVTMTRPSREAERSLLTRSDLGQPGSVRAVTYPAQLSAAIAATATAYVAPPITEYVLDIVDAVRSGIDGRTAGALHQTMSLSPRASKTLLRVAQAVAVLDGRGYVIPDDVREVAPECLAHRLVRSGDDRLSTLVDWVAAVTQAVTLP